MTRTKENAGLWFEPVEFAAEQHAATRQLLLTELAGSIYLCEILGHVNELLGWMETVERQRQTRDFADGIAAARLEIARAGRDALKTKQEASLPLGEFT